MSVQTYLYFDGNCREAVNFYAEAFGSPEPKFMLYGDVPPNPDFPLPDEAKTLVMHATLDIAGSTVLFSDVTSGMPITVGENVSLVVNFDSADTLKAAFDKLVVGGEVDMPLQETFWTKLYGGLTDKFGVVWQFNLEAK